MRINFYMIGAAALIISALSAGAETFENIAYTAKADEYAAERCKLDIFIPDGAKDFATVVWFHGGGIESGNKSFYALETMKRNNFAQVTVNYRLSKKIKAHEAIDDAAEAIAWVFKNIEKYGGNAEKIFVGGVSAGAYLTCMTALDSRYLAKYGVKNTNIAGIIPVSGQMTKHFNVRRDLGESLNRYVPVVDELAPLFYVDKPMPPVCIVTGDRNLEIVGRVEENLMFLAAVKHLKSAPFIEFYEMQGLAHGDASAAADRPMKRFIRRVLEQK